MSEPVRRVSEEIRPSFVWILPEIYGGLMEDLWRVSEICGDCQRFVGGLLRFIGFASGVCGVFSDMWDF